MLDYRYHLEPPAVNDDWRLIFMAGLLLALALLASGVRDQDVQDCTPRGVTTDDQPRSCRASSTTTTTSTRQDVPRSTTDG